MKTRVRSSVVVLHNNAILTFLGVDPTSGKEYHFLPGGEIEPHETAPEAAERETLEETGYAVAVDPASCVDKDYTFHWDGTDYHVLTFFYLARLINPFQQPKKVEDAAYNKKVVWVAKDKIADIFSYTDEIRDAILEIVSKL